jgi:hypothetical protein
MALPVVPPAPAISRVLLAVLLDRKAQDVESYNS